MDLTMTRFLFFRNKLRESTMQIAVGFYNTPVILGLGIVPFGTVELACSSARILSPLSPQTTTRLVRSLLQDLDKVRTSCRRVDQHDTTPGIKKGHDTGVTHVF